MSAAQIDPGSAQSGEPNASEKPSQTEYKGIVLLTVIEILAFAVGVGFAINFLFYALPRGNQTQVIIACAATVIFATIGVAAHLLAKVPRTDPSPSNQPIAAFQLEQRAWLAVKEITFSNHMRAGQIPTVEIVVVNTGRTPALDVSIVKTIRIDVALPDGGMPRPEMPDQSVAVLGPGIELVGESRLTRARTELEVVTLRRRASHLYAYGIIRYRDVFEVWHYTEYCVEAIPTSPTGEAAVCGKWNTAT
jgi:hypothetical protein